MRTASTASGPSAAATGSSAMPMIRITEPVTTGGNSGISRLKNGAISGAALDVFRGEPAVDPELARLGNLLPLPHIGSATVETRGAMLDLQRRNLDAVLAGRPALTPVN